MNLVYDFRLCVQFRALWTWLLMSIEHSLSESPAAYIFCMMCVCLRAAFVGKTRARFTLNSWCREGNVACYNVIYTRGKFARSLKLKIKKKIYIYLSFSFCFDSRQSGPKAWENIICVFFMCAKLVKIKIALQKICLVEQNVFMV